MTNEDHGEEMIACDVAISIYSDFGNLISRSIIDECENVGDSYFLDSWNLLNDEGCYIDFGKYTIVFEEDGFYQITEYFQDIVNSKTACYKSIPDFEVSSIIIDGKINTNMKIYHGGVPIRIYNDCLFEYSFESTDGLINELYRNCNYNVGSFLTPSNEYTTSIISPVNADQHEEIIIDGVINYGITLFSSQTINQQLGDVTSLENGSIIVEGKWSKVNYQDQTCWMLSSPNQVYFLPYQHFPKSILFLKQKNMDQLTSQFFFVSSLQHFSL